MKIHAKSLWERNVFAPPMLFIGMKTSTLVCGNCGKTFEKPTKEVTRQQKRGRNTFYCCQSCASVDTKTKHTEVFRICLECGKTFVSTTHKRHRTCCSLLCAKRFAHKHVDTKALSETMKRLTTEGKVKPPTLFDRTEHVPMALIDRPCCVCGTMFAVKPYNTRKTCSTKCYRDLLAKNSRKMFEDRVANGTWTSWRKNTEPSYPERFFMKVLKNNGIKYEYEFPVGRYSIDFALTDRKIALEIDGQQHRFLDRQISDNKKDAMLTSMGWKVFRIKWAGVLNDSRKDYIKNEIQNFLALYHTTPCQI